MTKPEGNKPSTKDSRRWLGTELGLMVKEALTSATTSSTFTMDNGRVVIQHQSPAPRGLRQIYTRELEFIIRLLAARVEDLTAQLKKGSEANETLTSEVEELRAARQTLDNQLDEVREANRKQIDELQKQIKELKDSNDQDSTWLNDLVDLMLLLENLFGDEHTVLNLTMPDGDGPTTFVVSLDVIELHYQPSGRSLIAHSKDGVDHPIYPQHIQLETDGAQPTESGLIYISALQSAVMEPTFSEFTAKWTDSRVRRTFVPQDEPKPTKSTATDDTGVVIIPGIIDVLPALGQLVGDIPTGLETGGASIPESTPVESTNGVGDDTEPPTLDEDPAANWTARS